MAKKRISLDELNTEEAFNRHQSIIQREEARRKLLIENIIDITNLFDSEEYKAIIGDEDASWSAYLSQLEVFYSRSEVNTWRRVINKFVNEYAIPIEELATIPVSRMKDLLSICKPDMEKERVYEFIGIAKTALPLDWKNVIAEQKGIPTSDDCEHQFDTVEICKKCGFKHKTQQQHEV
jgi:hypothetical protein